MLAIQYLVGSLQKIVFFTQLVLDLNVAYTIQWYFFSFILELLFHFSTETVLQQSSD